MADVIQSDDSAADAVSFFQAAILLAARLGTDREIIEHELAGWICDAIDRMDRTSVELRAFKRRSVDSESEFNSGDCRKAWDKSKANGYEYLAYFKPLYLKKSDVERFEPKTRYITGDALITRWLERGYYFSREEIKEKVLSCGSDVREMRVFWFHPLLLCISPDASDTPFETLLFPLAMVEDIEREDFEDCSPLSAFYPLTKTLEGWFDKPIEKLPEDWNGKNLRESIRRHFWPPHWKNLNAKQRENFAETFDAQHGFDAKFWSLRHAQLRSLEDELDVASR
jgi:hypothetical protein